MTPLPNMAAYPKTVMLRDGNQVELRPLKGEDKLRLLRFFEHVPEEERYYLKENVTAPEVIREWTSRIDFERVIPIVGVVEDGIVADATLHRSRNRARDHLCELRIVVDPRYRERGLGRRLIRELLDLAVGLGLEKAIFELVAQREKPAIMAAKSVGFREAAVLKGWVRDSWGNSQDLVVLEMSLKDHDLWWRF